MQATATVFLIRRLRPLLLLSLCIACGREPEPAAAQQTIADVFADMDLESVSGPLNQPLVPLTTVTRNEVVAPRLERPEVSLELGNVKIQLVTGDRESVAMQVRRYKASVTHCYSVYLRDSVKDLKGRIIVSLQIEAGRVTEAKVVSDSIKDENLATCVEKRVGRWRFPKPATGEVRQVFDMSWERAPGEPSSAVE
jgi:hypothetical protein